MPCTGSRNIRNSQSNAQILLYRGYFGYDCFILISQVYIYICITDVHVFQKFEEDDPK